MRLYAFAILFSVLASALSPEAAWGSVGPSVQDVVEFTQIIQPLPPDDEALRQQTSPDGTRAFIVTRKADVTLDANRYQILMLSLDPERLSQARPAHPEVVFSFDARFDSVGGYPALAQVQWVSDRVLIFRAKINDDIFQVYSLDLPTRKLVQLTQSSTPITSFAVSRNLKRLVYAAPVLNPPMKKGEHSIVVGSQWIRSVLYGQRGMKYQLGKYRFYVQDVGSNDPPRPLGEPFLQANLGLPEANISPDGRWAILPRYERDRTRAWSLRYPLLASAARAFGPALRRDPLGYFSGPMAFTARRMVAWRLDDGREQTILDAPDDARMGGGQSRRDKVWQPSGTSVVIAGTHLPLVDGQASTASHVIEYWPDSGRWAVIAKLNGRLGEAVGVGDRLEVYDGEELQRFRRFEGGVWRAGEPTAPEAKSQWTLRLRQDLNEPPDAMAEGPAGRTVRLTTLNPQFDAKSWGSMSTFTWRDEKGRPWRGGLLLPAGAASAKPLPLVIQAYFYDPKTFYLDGPNAAAQGFTSAYPGRALFREGVAVLGMTYRPTNTSSKVTSDENRVFNEGVRGAVNALAREGRIDPARVGIIGFSATGAKVMNLITFSDLPVRAATIADGDADTLFSYALTYAFADVTWGNKELINGGPPVRPNLATWVSRDPSMNTDCVKSALRIESYGSAITNNWDIYALLRRQYKPAEMIVIPDGAHGLSTPSERMVSLQGNVDWFKFWLLGARREKPVLAHETDASLRAQYEAWDQMATLKQADDRRPRCPLKSVG